MIIKKTMIIIFVFLLLPIYTISAYESYDDSYYGDDFEYDSSYSSSSDNGMWILWVIILVFIVGFIIWLAISIWVYKDAKKRGEDSPIIWLLVNLFGGLVGLIVWLVVRPPIGGSQISSYHSYNRNRFCPICGRNIPFNATFCPYCNKKI